MSALDLGFDRPDLLCWLLLALPILGLVWRTRRTLSRRRLALATALRLALLAAIQGVFKRSLEILGMSTPEMM